jgi:hypothetical protein
LFFIVPKSNFSLAANGMLDTRTCQSQSADR